MSEVLYLRFPDEATVLQVAVRLNGRHDLTRLPKDGWLDGGYYNIDVVGTVFDMTTNPPTPLPGFHVNGWWQVPEMLQQYRCFPGCPRGFGPRAPPLRRRARCLDCGVASAAVLV